MNAIGLSIPLRKPRGFQTNVDTKHRIHGWCVTKWIPPVSFNQRNLGTNNPRDEYEFIGLGAVRCYKPAIPMHYQVIILCHAQYYNGQKWVPLYEVTWHVRQLYCMNIPVMVEILNTVILITDHHRELITAYFTHYLCHTTRAHSQRFSHQIDLFHVPPGRRTVPLPIPNTDSVSNSRDVIETVVHFTSKLEKVPAFCRTGVVRVYRWYWLATWVHQWMHSWVTLEIDPRVMSGFKQTYQ